MNTKDKRSMYQPKWGKDFVVPSPDMKKLVFRKNEWCNTEHRYLVRNQRLYVACKNCELPEFLDIGYTMTDGEQYVGEYDHGCAGWATMIDHIYKRDENGNWFVWRLTMRSTDG